MITALGEDVSLRGFQSRSRRTGAKETASAFAAWLCHQAAPVRCLFMREIVSAAGREVSVVEPDTGTTRRVLMFGSNNYLGLATHPRVVLSVNRAAREQGVGLGGPPLLNGYTSAHRLLEERLAELKQKDDALLFSTGYSANVGLVSALAGRSDLVVFDEASHASFIDGVKLSGAEWRRFSHNHVGNLVDILAGAASTCSGNRLVGVEGVYSMEGDVAPLDRLATACKAYGALSLLDDAHGTGVVGPRGAGTAALFGVSQDIDLIMGTFSKAFAVAGGFVAGDRELITYLRFFARSHMFSAALPPVVVAAVHAGLDVLEHEPDLLERLRTNIAAVVRGFRQLGLATDARTPIFTVRVKDTRHLCRAADLFWRAGLFVNAVTYPAVPESEQRFRISITAEHTSEDLERLLACVAAVRGAGVSGDGAKGHRLRAENAEVGAAVRFW